jgi:hypothetical protein
MDKQDKGQAANQVTKEESNNPRVKRKVVNEAAAMDSWSASIQEKVMGVINLANVKHDEQSNDETDGVPPIAQAALNPELPQSTGRPQEDKPTEALPEFDLVIQTKNQQGVPEVLIEILVTTESVEPCRVQQHEQKVQVKGHLHNFESGVIQAVADSVRSLCSKALKIPKVKTELYQQLNVDQSIGNMQMHWTCGIPTLAFEPGKANELEKGVELFVQLAVDQEDWDEGLIDRYAKGSLSGIAVATARKLRFDRGGQSLPDGTQLESQVFSRTFPLGEALGPAPLPKESYEDKIVEGKFHGVSRKTWDSDFCVEIGRRWLEPQFKLEQYEQLYELSKIDADLCTITVRIHKRDEKIDHVELLNIGFRQPKLLKD